jgi:hypothetical protein
MKVRALLVALLGVLLTASHAAAQAGNPNNPADFIRNPHPAMPWAPNNPDRFLSETYGTVIQYIPVPPQQVAIPLPASAQAPTPEQTGAPAQTPGQTGVPAQAPEQTRVPIQAPEQTATPAQTREETGVPAQTREQIVEIPGYYVTETTTGYWYPERWTLQQVNVGVYRWVKLPGEFRRK